MISANRGRALRLKIRDALWRFNPKADAIEVGETLKRIERELGRNPLGTLEDICVPNCTCWMCLLRLHVEVAQITARRRTEIEADESID